MITIPYPLKIRGIAGRVYDSAKIALFMVTVAAAVGHFSDNEAYRIASLQSKAAAVERPYSRSAEKAALEGKVTIGIYNLNFSNDAGAYNAHPIERYVQTVFGTLDINADVTYKDIYPYVIENKHPEIGGAFGNAANFEEFVRFSSFRRNKEHTFHHIKDGKMFTDNPTLMIIDYLDAFRIRPSPQPDISIVIADFEDSKSAAITRYESTGYYGQPMCLVDRIYGGKMRDWKQIAVFAAHEALHRLTIPHSDGLLDIMSTRKLEPLNTIIKNAPWLAVGTETWLNWGAIKEDYIAKRQKTPEIKASPSSLQHLGNNKGFAFYKSHGYPQRWPKEMALGGFPNKVKMYLNK